ncbi:restriction endonuclease subunit S [Eubacterium xylanophilum]|uniref:restriction endonuclease subunit S n=1 Tax=Eubacterium xylanophilum TaxID=39497 RepID=UPI00047E33AA|nr:restriction endonuclease subunit S [Eubacterium xylanophilum]
MQCKKVILEDICLKISDGTHSTIKDDPKGECFLLSCKNIKNFRVNIGQTERRISQEQLLKLKKRTKLDRDDVLITTVGTIGEMAIVEDEDPIYDFQRSVGIIKPDTEKVNSRYLFYALINEIPQILSFVKGAVQQCLFLGDMKKISIQLPSLDEQSRIVTILKSIDDKIRLNESINDNLAV